MDFVYSQQQHNLRQNHVFDSGPHPDCNRNHLDYSGIWVNVLKWYYSKLILTQANVSPYVSNSGDICQQLFAANPLGRTICSRFQFPHTHQGMCALKSLIEMDWVIQLTSTHLGVLCAVEAIALGYCCKSLSHYRKNTCLHCIYKV